MRMDSCVRDENRLGGIAYTRIFVCYTRSAANQPAIV